jgi:hypothetical protein
MRTGALASACLILASSAAQADPYRWCADYGLFGNRGTNCYFMTIQQCRAAISGVGGHCRPNPFFDGRPVTTPEDRPSRRRR